MTVQRVRANPLHESGKLVAEDERLFNLCVPDAGVEVGVEIAAADTSGCDAQECFTRARRARVGDGVDTEIRRAVETRGEHGGGFWAGRHQVK